MVDLLLLNTMQFVLFLTGDVTAVEAVYAAIQVIYTKRASLGIHRNKKMCSCYYYITLKLFIFTTRIFLGLHFKHST